MKAGAIHIVWEDDNTGKVMYKKGTYTVSTVSVEQQASRELIEVYPNPAGESCMVRLDGIKNISSCYLSDMAGRHILLQPVVKNDTAIFALTGIAKGGYYFVMTDETGKSYYSKVIVQ